MSEIIIVFVQSEDYYNLHLECKLEESGDDYFSQVPCLGHGLSIQCYFTPLVLHRNFCQILFHSLDRVYLGTTKNFIFLKVNLNRYQPRDSSQILKTFEGNLSVSLRDILRQPQPEIILHNVYVIQLGAISKKLWLEIITLIAFVFQLDASQVTIVREQLI